MKILLVHNTYQQPGGEDVAFEQERRLLEHAGHEVIVYRRSNDELRQLSTLARITLVKRIVWASDSRQQFARLLDREKPNLVHVHNTFAVISPSIYSACRARRVPVVQTLHNFRLMCPAATLYRRGSCCTECLERGLWRSVVHGCYHDSHAETAAVALMVACHRGLGTWTRDVDAYIALTKAAREKFVSVGLPADKIFVKPNFVDADPGERTSVGNYAVVAGRLSNEKGLHTVLRAWSMLPPSMTLQIVGDGDLRHDLEATAKRLNLSNLSFRGRLSRGEVLEVVKGAQFLIMPSECYENFPLVIAESYACGIPVICSRLGAMQEIVIEDQTGLHFDPGNCKDLAMKLRWAINHPRELMLMGRNARREYETRYTADQNYALLSSIYERTVKCYA